MHFLVITFMEIGRFALCVFLFKQVLCTLDLMDSLDGATAENFSRWKNLNHPIDSEEAYSC